MDNLTLNLFKAYYLARKNKRNTNNQLRFEISFESEILRLAREIINRNYYISPSIAFIINKPVAREVFAADFRDRVVHHLLYQAINPVLEGKFIHDSYSCRKGKGTLYGIKRADRFIRSCSQNYHSNAWILKLDVEGYFMNINHQTLWNKTQKMMGSSNIFLGLKRDLIDYLLQKIIFHETKNNCIFKSKKTKWKILPNSKSLFYVPKGTGLPIGNLTSQLFGNIYLNDLDHYIKDELKVKYYGRYVDDMFFVHSSKEYLKSLVTKIEKHLPLGMRLHPKKIYLQHYTKGVLFLGQYIKPYRRYIGRRTKANFYQAIARINQLFSAAGLNLSENNKKKIQTTLNSYIGICKQANTYNLVGRMIERLDRAFYSVFYIEPRQLTVKIK
jgi:RNA-directed DNA polymerase